jgi:hypothetical protein
LRRKSQAILARFDDTFAPQKMKPGRDPFENEEKVAISQGLAALEQFQGLLSHQERLGEEIKVLEQAMPSTEDTSKTLGQRLGPDWNDTLKRLKDQLELEDAKKEIQALAKMHAALEEYIETMTALPQARARIERIPELNNKSLELMAKCDLEKRVDENEKDLARLQEILAKWKDAAIR